MRSDELCVGRGFELRALAFKKLDVRLGGTLRLPLGNQEIARETVLDLDDFAQVADVGYFFEQDDLHGGFRINDGR